MDPTITLREIQEHLADKNFYEAGYLAACLNEWLRKGGFQPEWNKYPVATEYYNTRYDFNKRI